MLKGHLGIEHKDPEVMALEDEALRFRRSTPASHPKGRPVPQPRGGMSLREIGETWTQRAMGQPGGGFGNDEKAEAAGRTHLNFDGSILGPRKFTSSELLDAGFNISVVAERQGHGPQELTRPLFEVACIVRPAGRRTPGEGGTRKNRRSAGERSCLRTQFLES